MSKRLQVSSDFFTTVPVCPSCVLLVAGNGFHSIRGCVMGIWICDGTEHCEISIQPRFDLRGDVYTSCSWCSDVVEGIWTVFTRIRGLLLLLAISIEGAPHGVHQSGRECKWIHLVNLTICWAWGILAVFSHASLAWKNPICSLTNSLLDGECGVLSKQAGPKQVVVVPLAKIQDWVLKCFHSYQSCKKH